MRFVRGVQWQTYAQGAQGLCESLVAIRVVLHRGPFATRCRDEAGKPQLLIDVCMNFQAQLPDDAVLERGSEHAARTAADERRNQSNRPRGDLRSSGKECRLLQKRHAHLPVRTLVSDAAIFPLTWAAEGRVPGCAAFGYAAGDELHHRLHTRFRVRHRLRRMLRVEGLAHGGLNSSARKIDLCRVRSRTPRSPQNSIGNARQSRVARTARVGLDDLPCLRPLGRGPSSAPLRLF